MAKEILERKDVDEKLTWDLSAIFETEEELEETIKKSSKIGRRIRKKIIRGGN